MQTRPAQTDDLDALTALRLALFPDHAAAWHRHELETLIARSDYGVFVSVAATGLVGFAEVALRRDYVNGCDTSPVAFLEGIYVAPDHRRDGAARALITAVEVWGRVQGCSELASDADLANLDSQRMHAAVGFEETERVVYFRKALGA
ncbi:aminoglycoside 6'-N-acetyltransferase [Phenylobacterium aquaticum]|uniref:aminoglycoside 6'-N-acetyltransferase n=1 Tax=Phenylobacterium aquaticum TaxID=1763816 RepID=UPI00350E479C